MILPHAEPPGKVSLRLHVDAGSLQEEEDQRGLAHFLEHMLFNGLRNFSPEELIPIMQRLGISFGSHANAYTSFDETVYMLDLPDTDEDTLDLCFTVMRDFADGALLLEDEIEKERGVVLAEMTARDSFSLRLAQQQFDLLFPDHLLAHRFPIGTEEVISNAPRERFVEFYQMYYAPQYITFVVSGDVDPVEMEGRIVEFFANMTNPEDQDLGTGPDLGTVPVDTGFRVAVFTDPEAKWNEISIVTVRPYESKPDTEANRIDNMPFLLANRILGRRFDVLLKQENSSISWGNAYQSDWYNAVDYGWIQVDFVDGRLEEAVMVLEQEFRRAMEFGFTQSELDEVKSIILNAYEQAVESATTRESTDLAQQLVDSVNGRRVFSSPEENLRIIEKALTAMTPERVHEDFVEFWDTEDITLIYSANEAPENATELLEALYVQSQAVEVAPPVDYGNITFAYTDFGTPGTIVSDVTQDDLDIRQLVLSNNVRLNMKKTDFEENSIIITARFGTGRLGQPINETGLDSFTSTVINYGGLGNHSHDELTRMLAGKSVSLQFFVESGGFSFAAATTPEDLELTLQLLAAYLSDPGYREEAVRLFRNAVPALVSDLKYTLSGAAKQMNAWLYGGDGRFAVPTEEGLLAFDVNNARSWIQPQITSSFLEVSIVGDFDETAIAYILGTLGALPVRANTTDANVTRAINFPEAPQNRTFTYESTLLQAAAYAVWEIPPLTNSNINETRGLLVLASTFRDRMRLKLREELGAAYSPSARSSPSSSFDYGQFVASSVVSPENATSVGLLIIEIAKELAGQGISDDELVRVLEPTFVDLEESLRSNWYWLNTVMAESQVKPYELDWARGRDEFYASIEVEDINELAKKYLLAENVLRVELLPVDYSDDESVSSVPPARRSSFLRV